MKKKGYMRDGRQNIVQYMCIMKSVHSSVSSYLVTHLRFNIWSMDGYNLSLILKSCLSFGF